MNSGAQVSKGFVPPRYRVLQLGDPVLRETSDEVIDFEDPELLQVVKRLQVTNNYAKGAGVCAPQIGLNSRVFAWKFERIVGHVVNPVIKERDGTQTDLEGCLSMPEMFFNIERSDSVHLVGRDMLGEEIEYEATGFFARLVQHELDHLNGVLLIDRLDDEQWKKFQGVWYERYDKLCPGDRQLIPNI